MVIQSKCTDTTGLPQKHLHLSDNLISLGEWLARPTIERMVRGSNPGGIHECSRLVKRLGVCYHVYVMGTHKKQHVDSRNMTSHCVSV